MNSELTSTALAETFRECFQTDIHEFLELHKLYKDCKPGEDGFGEYWEFQEQWATEICYNLIYNESSIFYRGSPYQGPERWNRLRSMLLARWPKEFKIYLEGCRDIKQLSSPKNENYEQQEAIAMMIFLLIREELIFKNTEVRSPSYYDVEMMKYNQYVKAPND